MKHKGACRDFNRQRDLDLLRAYRQAAAAASFIDRSIFKAVVALPSERFWVSEERAVRVVSAMLAGKPLHLSPCKQEMFGEIYRRALFFLRANPSLSLTDVISRVLSQRAPKFYLTPESARVIISRSPYIREARRRPHRP